MNSSSVSRRARQPVCAASASRDDSPVNDLANSLFWGEKNDGLGRYNGWWAIEEFTTVLWVTVQHEPREYPSRGR